MARKRKPEAGGIPARTSVSAGAEPYGQLVTSISGLVDEARRIVVRSTSSMIVSTYWEIGRRIVEFEQEGNPRAVYGEELLQRLGRGLARQHGRRLHLRGEAEAHPHR
jgi:hypothetical protein